MKDLFFFLFFYFLFLLSGIVLSYFDFKRKGRDWCKFLEESSALHFLVLICLISLVLFFMTSFKAFGFVLIFISAFVYCFYCLIEAVEEIWKRIKKV